MKTNATPPTGMKAFLVIAVGQAVSLLGSGMTAFAIVYWAWTVSNQATVLALAGFFSFGPTVLLSPVAGALVDRWNRKLVMMLSDLAAGLATVVLLILYLTGALQIWHLYVLGAFEGVFQAFQWPAYSAAISVTIPKAQYARANGLMELARAGSGILAPMLAGALIGVIGIPGILIIDIVTFLAAIGALLMVYIPQPPRTVEGEAGRGSLLQETLYGFRYILERPSLLWLQMVFFFLNLTASFAYTLMPAMILARTGNQATVLGTVQSVGAVGGVAGALLLSAWGGPKRKVYGVLGGMMFASLFGTLLMGLGRTWPVWALAAFVESATIPVLNGSNQAIWQAKVAPDVQGRVFAVRRWIAQITAPVGTLLAGPLADYVFEPALRPGGKLVPALGGLFGVGAGSGMALMFVIAGLLGFLVALVGALTPIVRRVEDILPDHDAIPVVR